jgi:hypothetical protein
MRRLLAGLLALGLVLGVLGIPTGADAWGPPFRRQHVPHFRHFHSGHFRPGHFIGGLGVGIIRDYHLDTLLGIAYTPGCGGRGDDGSAESPGKAGFSGSGFFFGEAPYASRRKASASGFGNTFRNASSVVHSLGFFFIGCPHEPDRPDS